VQRLIEIWAKFRKDDGHLDYNQNEITIDEINNTLDKLNISQNLPPKKLD
jgi:hypothetical protein